MMAWSNPSSSANLVGELDLIAVSATLAISCVGWLPNDLAKLFSGLGSA